LLVLPYNVANKAEYIIVFFSMMLPLLGE